MSNKVVSLLLVGAAVAAIAIAGCGESSEGDESSSTPALAKAVFVKRANQICRDSREEITTQFTSYMQQNLDKDEGVEERQELTAEAVKAVLVPQLEQRIDAIRALGTSRGGQEDVDAYLAGLQSAVNALKEEKASSFGEIEEVLVSAGDKGGEYGLIDC